MGARADFGRGKAGRAAAPPAMETRRRLLEGAGGNAAPPVYLLFGDEEYLVEDTAKRLVEKLAPEERRGFELEVLNGPSVSVAEMTGALATLPLFGGKRVAWLRGCRVFGSLERSNAVLGSLPPPGQGVTAVITEEKADRRFALFKGIQACGAVCEFGRLSETDERDLRFLRQVVEEKLRGGGHSIHPQALFYLVQLVGTDLRTVLSEVEKLSLHAGARPAIEKADCDLLVSATRETVAYRLSDAVASGELGESLSLLRRLLAQREEPLGMLAGMVKRIRLLLQARELMEARIVSPAAAGEYASFKRAIERVPSSVRDIYRESRDPRRYSLFAQHPYAAFQVFRAARRIPRAALRAMLDRAVRADTELKGGRRSKAEALEDLVIDLCAFGGGAASRGNGCTLITDKRR